MFHYLSSFCKQAIMGCFVNCLNYVKLLLTIQKLLGHKSLSSTTIYIHLARTGPANFTNPFDGGL